VGHESLCESGEGEGRLATGETQPLHGEELLRNSGTGLQRVIQDDRHQKHDVVGHIETAFSRESPFATEITFAPPLGGRGNHRHEISALANLPADFLIPSIATTEFVFVVPDFKSGRGQGFTQLSGRSPIF